MSLFICEKCGCIENTALSGFNFREAGSPALCSECDPKIGKWHKCFEKRMPEKGEENSVRFIK